jgi:hypothetical protein
MRVDHHQQLSLFRFRVGVMTEPETQGTSRDARAAEQTHSAALFVMLENSVSEVPEFRHHLGSSHEPKSPYLFNLSKQQ